MELYCLANYCLVTVCRVRRRRVVAFHKDPTHVMAQFSVISQRVPSVSKRVILSHPAPPSSGDPMHTTLS
jgi:hypothetical protein